MPLADTPNPSGDLFYRETLKALNKELNKIGSMGLEQNRLMHKLCDATAGSTGAVKDLTVVVKDLRDTLRDFKEEFVAMRAEMKTRRASRDRREDTQPRGKIVAIKR